MPDQILRITDANLNRIGEGLRLLEEMARLLLNDVSLTHQLKTMRHELVRGDWLFHQQLLQARDSESDVGSNLKVVGEEEQRELPLIIVANAKRVQESLRVMEEITKSSNTLLDTEKFSRARFSLYQIERTLLSKLMRQDKIKQVVGPYAIIDCQVLKGRGPAEATEQIIQGGATIIQLRDKFQTKKELLFIAQKLKRLCSEHNILFIVNDYLDVALASDADGLHVGQTDLPVKEARRLLPMNKLLGCSTRTVAQAVSAQADGADYIAVGSMYPTSSKKTAEVVGLDRLRQIKKEITLPLVAIGGINKDNVAEVIAAGANSAAVISAILQAEDLSEATQQIVNKFEVENE